MFSKKIQLKPHPFSLDEFLKLLGTTFPRSLERYLVYGILFYTGMRFSEMRRITVDQLILDGKLPHIHTDALQTKHHEEALIPVAKPLCTLLRDWIATRRQNNIPTLFDGCKTLYGSLQRDLEQAQIMIKHSGTVFNIHSFRLSHAAVLQSIGVDSRIITASLRINPTSNTENRVSLEQISESVNKLPDLLFHYTQAR